MKKIIFLLLTVGTFLATFYCKAQNSVRFDYDNFESQVLAYNPNHNSNVSKKDFDYGMMILNETKTATKNRPENFNLADYFNVFIAFLKLEESNENIKIAFEKFKNADGSCEYCITFENSLNKNPKFDFVRAEYDKKMEECKLISTQKNFDAKEYSLKNNLDYNLVQQIYQIDSNDRKYRDTKDFLTKQKELDSQNQKIINELHKKYKTYIGKSLVGEKFESVMWAVIQHSNIEMMEKYLPVVHIAVKEKELSSTPLKMLIDRYYGLKYGYQVFGSQSSDFGFKMADEKKRKEIKLQYGIE